MFTEDIPEGCTCAWHNGSGGWWRTIRDPECVVHRGA